MVAVSRLFEELLDAECGDSRVPGCGLRGGQGAPGRSDVPSSATVRHG
jgi:hypothetical protein